MADDVRQAMIDRFVHAEAVCRTCADFRKRMPCLPVVAERAAVALALPVPILRKRLEHIERRLHPCR